MHTWTDDELRAFLRRLKDASSFLSRTEIDDTEREAFVRSAVAFVAPRARRRLLETVGAETSPRGIAEVAYEIAEHASFGPEYTWLMASTRPWEFLADLTVRRIRRAYRATVGKGDKKATKGVEEASTRLEIEG